MLWLEDGAILEDGSPRALAADPNSRYARWMLEQSADEDAPDDAAADTRHDDAGDIGHDTAADAWSDAELDAWHLESPAFPKEARS